MLPHLFRGTPIFSSPILCRINFVSICPFFGGGSAVNKAGAPSGSVRSHTVVCSLPFPAAPSLLIPQACAEGILSASVVLSSLILCRRDFVSISPLSAFGIELKAPALSGSVTYECMLPRLPIRTPIFCGVILCRFGCGSAVKTGAPSR